MAEPLKILVFLGSTREGRNGERVGKFIIDQLKSRGHMAAIEDPLELDLPLLRKALHFYDEKSRIPSKLSDLDERIRGADAIVIVTPEYNRQLPPAIINLLDHMPPSSFAFKTSAIVTYSVGPGGGAGVVGQARELLVEFGCPPTPCVLSLPKVTQALSPSGVSLADGLASRAGHFISHIEWFGAALRAHRKIVPPPFKGPVVSVP